MRLTLVARRPLLLRLDGPGGVEAFVPSLARQELGLLVPGIGIKRLLIRCPCHSSVPR